MEWFTVILYLFLDQKLWNNIDMIVFQIEIVFRLPVSTEDSFCSMISSLSSMPETWDFIYYSRKTPQIYIIYQIFSNLCTVINIFVYIVTTYYFLWCIRFLVLKITCNEDANAQGLFSLLEYQISMKTVTKWNK